MWIIKLWFGIFPIFGSLVDIQTSSTATSPTSTPTSPTYSKNLIVWRNLTKVVCEEVLTPLASMLSASTHLISWSSFSHLPLQLGSSTCFVNLCSCGNIGLWCTFLREVCRIALSVVIFSIYKFLNLPPNLWFVQVCKTFDYDAQWHQLLFEGGV